MTVHRPASRRDLILRSFVVLAVAGGGTLAGYLAVGCADTGDENPGRQRSTEGPDAGVASAIAPQNPNLVAAPAHVRRLTVTEVRNSMRDVFGLDDSKFDWASAFPTEQTTAGFSNQFPSLGITTNFATSLQGAAEWAGAAVVANLSTLLSCDAAANGEATCAGKFVDTYGLRVYRRPLSADERATLLGVFTTTRQAEDFPTAIATVVESMLQSPNFFYRTELGSAKTAAAPLTPYEMASALSFFLLQTTPDPTLLDAAAQGHMATHDDITAAASHLAQDPRAAASATNMLVEWLGVQGLPGVTKSSTLWSADAAQSSLGEISTFMGKTVWSGAQGYRDLFSSTSSFIDANLAPIYGAPAPSDPGLSPVQLDATQRAGFLTMPGFIASHNPDADRIPVVLGKFVRTQLFCRSISPPPPNIPALPVANGIDEHARFANHESNPACNSCHKSMDPIGFGWSQFDSVGQFNPQDYKVTEDGSGSIVGTDVDGPFKGPVELGKKLASSAMVRSCFASTVAQWALGRSTTANDPKSADSAAIQQGIASGFADGDIKSLFVAIATSDAFLFRDTTAVPQ